MGLLGGSFVASLLLGLDAHEYWSNAWQTLVFSDVFMGLIKPLVFGLSSPRGCIRLVHQGGRRAWAEPYRGVVAR